MSGNNCIVDTNNQAGDPNCASYVSGICVKCVPKSFMNSNGKCQAVNQNCQTYSNLNGACLTCYSGFSLNNGQCLQSQITNGCTQFNIYGNCLQCAQGYYLNANSCVQIDVQCANFNYISKQCTACYSEYTLLSGVCQISKWIKWFQYKIVSLIIDKMNVYNAMIDLLYLITNALQSVCFVKHSTLLQDFVKVVILHSIW